MELLELVLRIHDCDTPGEALRALVGVDPLRAAAWTGAAAGAAPESWPEEFTARVLEEGVTRGTVPEVRSRGGGEELLLMPLGEEYGALVVAAGAGAFPGDPLRYEPIGRAFRRLLKRHALAREAGEAGALRQRAEESEALHVLGLAANRSLDPDEVLDLVSRFTRTLLGGHYVTVSTREEGSVRTVAAVGLRTPGGLAGDDPFAARVIERRKAITLDAGDLDPGGEYPFHAAEGMLTGLGVPLSLYGGTFGALVVGYRREYSLAPRDTRLALTLAGHAAVAISNARLHRDLRGRSRELESAYEELRWTAQAKERFFASMSHELRTPLNAVLGFQSLLLDGVAGPLAESQQAFLDRAHRATKALLLLVNDVLDLSKLEAGKMEIVNRSFELGDLVREALYTIHPMAAAKGVEVRGPPTDDRELLIHTDPDRVRQILLNLLSNAVKFTDRGEVVVGVAAPEPGAEGTGGFVELRVRDDGPGIDPADQDRIFQEFEQVSGAQAEGGTGLGLPISRKLARLLGGELRVESEPGTGATFLLRLPVGAPAAPGTGVASNAATAQLGDTSF